MGGSLLASICNPGYLEVSRRSEDPEEERDLRRQRGGQAEFEAT